VSGTTLVPYKLPACVVQADDAASGDELAVAIETALDAGHAVHDVNKSEAAVFAGEMWAVETTDIHIDGDQDGEQEESESHIDRAAAAVQGEEDVEQDEAEESRRCGDAEDEEQCWESDGEENEARPANFPGVRGHGECSMVHVRTDQRRLTKSF